MSAKLQEIQRKIAKLKKDAEELRQLKLDCATLKRFRDSIIDTKYD